MDFSAIEGHEVHLQAPKDAIALTDGTEVFGVPRKYVAAILKAVPQLRYSFEHLGGQHHGHDKTVATPKDAAEKNFTAVPWKDTR